jgi:hypothetical protein
MIFINKYKYLGGKSLVFEKYSLYLNKVRKNLAALGKQLLRCSTTYVPVGDLGRSPLMRSYGYASAGDQPTLLAIFPLNFVPFMQYAG